MMPFFVRNGTAMLSVGSRVVGAGRLNCLNIRQVTERGKLPVLSVLRYLELHELMLRNRKSVTNVRLAEQQSRYDYPQQVDFSFYSIHITS